MSAQCAPSQRQYISQQHLRALGDLGRYLSSQSGPGVGAGRDAKPLGHHGNRREGESMVHR